MWAVGGMAAIWWVACSAQPSMMVSGRLVGKPPRAVGLVGGRVGDGAPDVSVEGEFFSVGVCDDVDGEGAAVFGEFEACYVGLEGWVSVEGGGGSWAVGPYGVAVFGEEAECVAGADVFEVVGELGEGGAGLVGDGFEV